MRPCGRCKNPGCAARGMTAFNYEGNAITCYGFEPMTHADRIRSKSDEELATWVETIAGCDLCPMLDEQCSGGEVNSRASCKRHWLEWLRQEAEE